MAADTDSETAPALPQFGSSSELAPTPLNIAAWAAQKAEETEPGISIRQGAYEPLVRQNAAKQFEGQEKPQSRMEAAKQRERAEQIYWQELERMVSPDAPEQIPAPERKNYLGMAFAELASGVAQTAQNVTNKFLNDTENRNTGLDTYLHRTVGRDAAAAAREEIEEERAAAREEAGEPTAATNRRMTHREDAQRVNAAAESAVEEAQANIVLPEADKFVDYADRFVESVSQEFASEIESAPVVADVARGVGGVIPAIAANFVVPGAGGYVTFTSAAQGATDEAMAQGASEDAALLYGTAVGGMELIIGKAFDGMAGVLGKGAADDLISSAARKAFQNNKAAQGAFIYFANSLGEGFEEFATEYANALANRLTVKTDQRSFGEVTSDALYSLALGAVISDIVQAGQIAATGRLPSAEELADSTVAQMEQAETQTETLTPSLETLTEEENAAPVQGDVENTSVNDNYDNQKAQNKTGGVPQSPGVTSPLDTSETASAVTPPVNGNIAQQEQNVNRFHSPITDAIEARAGQSFNNPFTEAANRFAVLRLRNEFGTNPSARTAWSNPQNLATEDVAVTFRQRLGALQRGLADYKYASNPNAGIEEENPYEPGSLISAVVDTVKDGVAKVRAKNATPEIQSVEDVETKLNELRQIYDYMKAADPAFDPITPETIAEAVNAPAFTDLDVKRFLPVLSRDVQQRYGEIADAYEDLAARLVSGDTSATVMSSYLRAQGIMEDVIHDAQIELAKLVPKLKANPEYLGQLLEEVRSKEQAAQTGQALQEDIRRYQELISSRASRAAAFAFDPSTANRKALYDGDYTADLLRQRIAERVFEETEERVSDVDAYIALLNNPLITVVRRAGNKIKSGSGKTTAPVKVKTAEEENSGYLGQAWDELTKRSSPAPVVTNQGPQVLYATILHNGGQTLMERIDSYLDMKSRYDQMGAAFFADRSAADPQELGALARQLDSKSLGVIKQIFDNSGYQIQDQREFEAFLKFYQEHRQQP